MRYFPEEFPESDAFNYYQQVVKRSVLIAQSIIQKKDFSDKIRLIDDWFMGLMAPKNFDPSNPNNAIISHEKEFEKICAVLEELGVTYPEKLTVYKFYNKLEYFKNKPVPEGKQERNS